MIWRLLKHNISKWQIGGYAAATLVGLIIVMAAVQLYHDLAGALLREDSNDFNLLPPRNLVISKPVGLLNTLGNAAPSFSDDEIDEITHQPWCRRVSRFQAADFGVWAGVDMGGRGMSTSLFFESVPDDLVDIDGNDWSFDPSRPEIPIVLSRDYLALYNFGFAASGRMPMISEGVISSIPITIVLTGNGLRESVKARIVGFSSWLNTIAVPQAFMDWAHERYGSGAVEQPSRLVVEVSDPGDEAVDKFFSRHGYEIAGPQDNLGRTSRLLTMGASAIVGVGAVITLLAIAILVLSLYLLVTKNRATISGLLLLGYTPAEVSRRYIALVASINVGVLVLATICACVLSHLWSPAIETLGAAVSAPLTGIAVGALIIIAITALNAAVIHRLVRRCF